MMRRHTFLRTAFSNYCHKKTALALIKFSTLVFIVFAPFMTAQAFEPLIYMRPNETPVFTELYQHYGLLNPPALHVYDSSI
ncbi:MAG: hypothetical protein ACHP6H_05555, partial [Legionellales bacterium]